MTHTVTQFEVEVDQYFLVDNPSRGANTVTMTFVDWEHACDWAGRVTMSSHTDFVVLEMRGPNGEMENF